MSCSSCGKCYLVNGTYYKLNTTKFGSPVSVFNLTDGSLVTDDVDVIKGTWIPLFVTQVDCESAYSSSASGGLQDGEWAQDSNGAYVWVELNSDGIRAFYDSPNGNTVVPTMPLQPIINESLLKNGSWALDGTTAVWVEIQPNGTYTYKTAPNGAAYIPTSVLKPYTDFVPSKIAGHFDMAGVTTLILAANTYESISFTVLDGSFNVEIEGTVINYEAGVHPSMVWGGKPIISSEFKFTKVSPDSKIIINTMK